MSEVWIFSLKHAPGLLKEIRCLENCFENEGLKVKSIDREELSFKDKDFLPKRYLLGGIIFGLGWGLTGACPGPMFTLLGAGFYSISIVIFFAILGTLFYGILKNKLPH